MRVSKTGICLAGILITGLVLVFWPTAKGKSCTQVSDDAAASFVKTDYLGRMERWDEDANYLGTKTPEIKLGKINRDVTNDKSIIEVPFIAVGPGGHREYFGMYQCDKGYVEYAIK